MPLSVIAGADLTLNVPEKVGEEIFALAAKIYPICRSITGEGVRTTLRALSTSVALRIHEVPTGTQVFDWAIPREWNITDAYIKNENDEKIVDFKNSNLHVMSYSVPVRRRMPLDELKKHIHTLPDQPDLTPYRTSYYAEDWAFCMPHRLLQSLRPQTYEVLIDSTLSDGHLTYGEYLHRGETDDEVLLSAHICHPSLANDNCSGIALLARLAHHLHGFRTRLSYRFLFAPGTIGAIAWLARNEENVERIKHGLVLSMVGDAGAVTYKKSRRGNADIDRAMMHTLRHAGSPYVVEDFSPYGYDERQYCSPGFNLPVGLFQRSKFASIPQYHTSADNLDFIHPEHLEASFRHIVSVIETIEANTTYQNANPKCEPQLGRRGLYGKIGGNKDAVATNMAMLWILNMSDGDQSLLDIAERSDIPFSDIQKAARLLEENGLLIGERVTLRPPSVRS